MRLLPIMATLLLFAACSSDKALPAVDAAQEDQWVWEVGFENSSPGDVAGEDACTILWQMKTYRSGATAHPAMSKQGLLYLASYQKLYALDPAKTGKEVWVWPDGDTQSGIGALDEQLYTPAIGLEGALALGSSAQRLLVINKNGIARFALEVQGPITGAPAISADKKIVVVTDQGALYLVRDLGQNKPHIAWSKTGDEAFSDVLPGQQPLIGLPADNGHEVIWLVRQSSVDRFDLETGDLLGQTPLPEGHTATSNAILDDEGRLWVATGSEPAGVYYGKSWVVGVQPDGALVPGTPMATWSAPTVVIALTQGAKETLVLGTRNAGVMLFSLITSSKVWSGTKGYQDVAPGVQAGDGTLYFGAMPHWVLVYSEGGELAWQYRLDGEGDALGSQYPASSPIVMGDGTALFRNGNVMMALKCTDAGPASGLVWPRFGGNDANTGNLADSMAK